jgi:hypothetical protein
VAAYNIYDYNHKKHPVTGHSPRRQTPPTTSGNIMLKKILCIALTAATPTAIAQQAVLNTLGQAQQLENAVSQPATATVEQVVEQTAEQAVVQKIENSLGAPAANVLPGQGALLSPGLPQGQNAAPTAGAASLLGNIVDQSSQTSNGTQQLDLFNGDHN